MRLTISRVILLVLTVIAMWLGSWLFIIHKLPGWSERAAFGEMFGAVGALFSGLAFAGLILTLHLQLQQLELNSQQLKDTREELRKQKEELRAQTETLAKQRFEGTFFHLLKLQSDIVRAMDIDIRPGLTRRGRDCFVVIYNELYQTFKQMNRTDALGDEIAGFNKLFQGTFHRHRADLGHYFNHLRSIVEFVDVSGRADRSFYISLLISELSTHEQLLLFYYGLSAGESFKPLIEKYGILRHLPKSDLLAKQHVALYESLSATSAAI